MKELHLSIKTTTKCQGKCSDCSVRPWMKADPGYEASIEDIEKLVYYSTLSGYKFKSINFSGGEPLLWSNLVEGSKILHDSKITDSLILYSNALVQDYDLIGSALENLEYIRVSKYDGNEDCADKLKARFGDKIRITDKQLRPTPPWKRIPNTLPATCGCIGYGLDHGVIDVCAPVKTLIVGLGWDLKDYEWVTEPLGKNFMERFLKIDRFNMKFCEYCIGNKKIYPFIEHGRCVV